MVKLRRESIIQIYSGLLSVGMCWSNMIVLRFINRNHSIIFFDTFTTEWNSVDLWTGYLVEYNVKQKMNNEQVIKVRRLFQQAQKLNKKKKTWRLSYMVRYLLSYLVSFEPLQLAFIQVSFENHFYVL